MVPFQGVIAILLSCLTFFQWLRPEDEPNSQQEIDPWREWNGIRQMGVSVHSAENVCVCVYTSLFTCKTYFWEHAFSDVIFFPQLSELTKYSTTSFFIYTFKKKIHWW